MSGGCSEFYLYSQKLTVTPQGRVAARLKPLALPYFGPRPLLGPKSLKQLLIEHQAAQQLVLISPRVSALRNVEKSKRSILDSRGSGASGAGVPVQQARSRRPVLSQRPASADCSRSRSRSASVLRAFVPLVTATPSVSPVGDGPSGSF